MYSLIISFIVANCVLTVFNKDNDDDDDDDGILHTVWQHISSIIARCKPSYYHHAALKL